MIKINLLREPSRKKAKFAQSENRSLVYFGLALLLAVVAFGYWWRGLSADIEEKRTKLQSLQVESQRLQKLQAELKKYEEQSAELERRLGIVEQLRKNQTGPVNLMNSLIQSVPDDPRLWLTNLTQRGTAVTVEGNAFDVPAIAGFISGLGRRSPFSNVDLDFWEQEPSNLKFKLSCEVENK